VNTVQHHRLRDPPRACDICGHLWHKSDLTRIGPLQWACPDDVDGLTALQIARHNANARPLRVLPVRHGKGMTDIATFQSAEASLFQLIVKQAPAQVFLAEGGSIGDPVSSAASTTTLPGYDLSRCAGFSALYLANIALENERPFKWITEATTAATALADQMLAQQFGSSFAPALYGTFPNKTHYGAFYLPPPAKNLSNAVINLDVVGNSACLLALVAVYRLTGATKYRDGARLAATFLRRAQCLGSYNEAIVGYSQTNAGARLPQGPFADTIVYDLNASQANNSGATFHPGALIGAWAMQSLLAVDGDKTYGDVPAALPGTDFIQPTAALLSQSIQQALTWWLTTGAFDGNTLTTYAGFSVAAPRSHYISSVFPSVGAGIWSSGSPGIVSADWALGLRATWEVEAASQRFLALYNFLRGMTPNPANAVPTTWNRDQIAQSLRGVYNPNLCLATQFSAGSEATGFGYDWQTVGILSAAQAALGLASLQTAKATMSALVKRSWQMRLTGAGAPANKTGGATTVEAAFYVRSDVIDDLRQLTQSGLSLQTSSGTRRFGWSGLTNGHYIDLVGAALVGDAYRHGRAPIQEQG
jgi:hypothetical protein